MMSRHLLIGSLAALAACSSTPSKMSMVLVLDGKTMAECPSAEVSELGGGGWRFTCNGSDVYVIYDSTTAKDGTIKAVEVKSTATSGDETWLPAVAVTRNPALNLDCPSAKALGRKTGEPPLETRGAGPAPGTYELALADPCGTAILTLGPPR